MGKTAEMLALCVLSPPPIASPTLVICPQHLCTQWASEITRMTPSLTLLRLYTGAPQYMSDEGIHHTLMHCTSDIIVTSLEFAMRFPLANVSFHRIILDECHDAVALGSATTKRLAAMDCHHFWCVTGTPFPQGDDSAYGM